MSTCGIIAEYNPFHNGHLYQIRKARELTGCDTILVIMSGNFVQRGEPAVIDKWQRAEAAILNGADVVIELPYLYATQSASAFAKGGVSLLNMAEADYICFGSECGNLENLQEIAETSINPDHLRTSLDAGMSYPKAYSLLTSSMAPNDILGVSYLKAMAGTKIKPVLIQRTGSYTDETMGSNASALAIRTALKKKENIEGSTPMEEALRNSELVTMDQFYPYLRTILTMTSPEDLSSCFLCTEGIEYHLKKKALTNSTWEGFLNDAVTYRYTASRIRRTCLQIMMQMKKQEVKELSQCDCLRLLAFNNQGRNWLHDMRKKEVRIASRFADETEQWRKIEYRSALLYTSVMNEENRQRLLKQEISGALYIR